MEKKLGGIELGGTFGGYEIINLPCDKLPQDVASAVSEVNANPILGATYYPVWYVGKQLVNGVNHLFIAEDIRMTKNKDKGVVGLVINVPPGENAFKGEGARIERIIDGEELPEAIQTAFTEISKSIVGVSYKPVMYVGKQLVKGENHYIVCEARTVYPYTQPFAAVMCINVFEGKASLVGIAPIRKKKADDEQEGLFGYAFNW